VSWYRPRRSALAARRHPGLLAERAGSLGREDAKPWDKVLAPFLALGGLVVPLIAGLEERFGWTPEPFRLPVKIAAIALLVLGYALSSWALIENAFFSGVVRLQTDRGQTVCTSGPYRWVRHPGYAGGFGVYLAMPLILDSAWAIIPVALLLAVTIVRTRLEDRTLQEELPGYRGYAKRVEYRLFPGIW
jgi:protein-S-isoprenylcysteine O-methyltransferase Ste14